MIRTSSTQRKEMIRKILSHVYSFVDTFIGFFVMWTFFAMMRNVVGLSTEIYWLSKSTIQQVSFIAVALVVCCVVIMGQWLFERSMNRHDTYVPKSFIVMTAALIAAYAVCKFVVLFYTRFV